MKTDCLSITALSDQQLIAQVVELARREREATAGLVAHLAEFGTRKLYLGAGCSSLFTYCTEVLHLSEHESYLRITAARLSRRFPIILDKLENGAVNLTTLKLLRKVLNTENHVTLLAATEHKCKRQVEELVASIAPQPAVKNWVRKLPAQVAAPAAAPLSAASLVGVTHAVATPAASRLVAVTPETASPAAAMRAAAEPGAATRAVAERRVETAAVATAFIAPLAPQLYK